MRKSTYTPECDMAAALAIPKRKRLAVVPFFLWTISSSHSDMHEMRLDEVGERDETHNQRSHPSLLILDDQDGSGPACWWKAAWRHARVVFACVRRRSGSGDSAKGESALLRVEVEQRYSSSLQIQIGRKASRKRVRYLL